MLELQSGGRRTESTSTGACWGASRRRRSRTWMTGTWRWRSPGSRVGILQETVWLSYASFKTFCLPCTDAADCQIILSTLYLKINESEWTRSSHNFVVIILRCRDCESAYICIHTIHSCHCYCVIVCVLQYGWMRMSSLCILPMFVPKVEAGEQVVVPRVELGKQRVNLKTLCNIVEARF